MNTYGCDCANCERHYALCVQMFCRNPIHSFTREEHPANIHTNNKWHVMSYYDGMCITPISGVNKIFDNAICVECTEKCTLKEMAIHCDRKRLYLLSKNGAWKKAWKKSSGIVGEEGRKYVESRLPFVAVIGIKRWNESQDALQEAIDDAFSETFYSKYHRGKDGHFAGDIWYHSFLSIGINDSYVLLYINSADHIETVVQALQYSCTVRGILIKTYSTFGINKYATHNMEENQEMWYSRKYPVSIRLLTLPGLEDKNTIATIRDKLREKSIKASVKSIMGSFDVEIKARMSFREYSQLLKLNELLGWKSDITLRSNSHIHFTANCQVFDFPKSKQHDLSRNLYTDLVNECQRWLEAQYRRSYDELQLSQGNTLHKIFLSVFTLACQRLASPQVWNQFAEVRSFIENYLTLLNDSIIRYRSRSANIDNSIEQMTHELYVLANERLSIEGPSSEKIGNSVYEKGAYEKIINAWSIWLNTLCKIAYLLSDGDDTRAVSFMIIPTIYGQTKSLNHIEFNHLSSIPRSIVVYLSVREMFRVSEMLLTLAHEVGHYCAITQRKQRSLFFIYCVCTSSIAGTLYIWQPDGRTKRTPQNADMDRVDLYWMTQLHMKVSDIMMTALQNTEYLDECASQVRAIMQEVFQEEPSSRKAVNDIKNCFLKYCPALCEDQQVFESYGFRLVHLLERRIKDYVSIIREINADLFMLYVLQPELLDYLKIIVEQATDHLGLYHLLECVEIVLDNDAEISHEQSAWYTLYMRLSCCIISYYVHSDCEEKREADLLAVLRTVKEQADAQNDKAICKLLACIIAQIEKLEELESSDSFCLDILCRYGKHVLTQFGQKNDTGVERLRELYKHTKCLSRESTIASLYHFLDYMEDWS